MEVFMELDLKYEANNKGRISDRCRFIDEGGCRYVLVDEKLAYLYDLNDIVAARQISVFLHRSKAANQKELAQALGVTERTLRYWVARYRKEGAAGLVDKIHPGAPVKLTDEVIKQIRRYRQQRMKVTDIAHVMNLGLGSVCRVLYQNKETQGNLFAERSLDVDNEIESSNTKAPLAAETSLPTESAGIEGYHEVVDESSQSDQAGSLSKANKQLGNEQPGEVDGEVGSAIADNEFPVHADLSPIHGSKGEKVSAKEVVCDIEAGEAETTDLLSISTQSEPAIQLDSPVLAPIESSDCQPEGVSIDEGGEQDLEAFALGSDSGEDVTDGWDSSVIDPLDRSDDRMWARLGMIEDANPIFVMHGREDKIEFAGAFLAIALLTVDPYLKVAKAVYRSFGAAFYGIRSIFQTFILMPLLRIKNSEEIRDYNPHKVGRLLGLDRSPEVKTLRRKLGSSGKCVIVTHCICGQ
jgi:transposase